MFPEPTKLEELPDGHPFKGGAIVFGMKRPSSSSKKSADEKTESKEDQKRDPKEQKI